MTDLEDRLRRDLTQLSERAQPGSIRPLRDPSGTRRSRPARWVAAVAAVAAVLGLITGVALAGRSTGRLPDVLGAPGVMPPYYVAVNQTDSPAPQGIVNWAIVHDSATGAALTTMRLPTLKDTGGTAEGPSISGAADGRTFVITEFATVAVGTATRTMTFTMPPDRRFPHGHKITSHIPADVHHITRFYLLRIAADGRSASSSPLLVSIPRYLAISDVALSPDGSRLAMAEQFCRSGGCQYTGIRLVVLATGAVRTWTTRANGAPLNVSWAGNGQVAFQWQGTGSQGYRLLSLAAAGGDLLAASRAIAGPEPVAADGGYLPRALVTPDASAVITTAIQNVREGGGRVTVAVRFVALSAGTGQLLRVLYTATERGVPRAQVGAADQSCNVLALGPTGVHVLVRCFDGFGRLDGGQFTPLPGIPNPNATTLPGPYVSGTGTW